MKEKGFKILLGIYILALIGDLITTLLNWGLLEYLEANPLYKYGGLPLIMFVNAIAMVIFYLIYTKSKSPSQRFIVMFFMVAIIITRLIAMRINYLTYLYPPTLEQAKAVTTAMKVATVRKLVLVNMLPFFNGFFAWIFFKTDHEVTPKWKKKEKKKERRQ